MKRFNGNFTQQEPIPEEAIENAVAVMRSGRLHRYNVIDGEVGETALLESEFATYQHAKYCLACASGGYAMHIALKAYGLTAGQPVLTNAFTLSPVPGAIDNAGGKPVLVETTPDLVIDLADLKQKIRRSGAKLLLLSHMRGHIVDMDALCDLLDEHNIALIEDCAHTMGARWHEQKSGQHGLIACFSTQTYKHINSGEGGFITTDDPAIMARAVLHSGSYMLYERHVAAPEASAYEQARYEAPNYSGRMDNLRAAILRVQLRELERQCNRWNQRYNALARVLRRHSAIRLPERPCKEHFVGSSLQFFVEQLHVKSIERFLRLCLERGVELKWFGADEPAGYTSHHGSWRYIDEQKLPQTDRVLASLCDIRIPLTFSPADCELIGEVILECYDAAGRSNGE